MDFFLGTGTTASVAHKLGRKWIGVERGEQLDQVAVPRLKKVLAGMDPYGITEETRWAGGGTFQALELEGYGDSLCNTVHEPKSEGSSGERTPHLADRGLDVEPIVTYQVDRDKPWGWTLNQEIFWHPFQARIRVLGPAGIRPIPVDLVETFNLLLGVKVETISFEPDVQMVSAKALDGQRIVILWRDLAKVSDTSLKSVVDRWMASRNQPPPDRLYVNGKAGAAALQRDTSVEDVQSTEEVFEALMFQTGPPHSP